MSTNTPRPADQSRFVHSGGVSLCVHEWSVDKPETIVLVHGYPDCSDVWDAVVARLQDDFHVVTYDVRGAGESSAPKRVRDYRLDRLEADFVAVIDTVSPDHPVHLVAHDWGSIQSWEPVTNPDLRHRIASYTSVSGPCLDHVGRWMRKRLTGDTAARKQAINQLAHSWYIMMFQVPVGPPALWRFGLDKRWSGVIAKLENLPDYRAPVTQRKDGTNGIKLYRANMLQRLLKPRDRYTEVPVQILIPEGDPFVSTALLEDTERWVSDLSMETLAGGHWMPLSQPALLASRITQFASKHSTLAA